MPFRNLIILCSVGCFSLVCYAKAIRSHYGSLLAAAIGIVADEYVEPVQKRELMESALDGMLRKLDPYSAYISPKELQKFDEEIDQEFGGVGVEVEIDPQDRRLTILSPLPDTPAFRAGLQSGDVIEEIDGQSTEGFDLRDAVDLMRGKPGTPVRLSIVRFGLDHPIELTVERAIIPVASVLGDQRRPDGTWDFTLREQPNIAYIRLVSFGELSSDEMLRTLSSCAESKQYDALILDLRGNPGGLLNAAVAVADMFLDEGEIVSVRYRRENDRSSFEAKPKTTLWRGIPVVVLVNRYSASASEIVAACLQDHGRAIVVGERTWGKGTVQNALGFEGGKSRLRITTATYWRPSGRNIHRGRNVTEQDEWGVRPDAGYEVKLSDEDFQKVMLWRRQRDYSAAFGGAESPTTAHERENVPRIDETSDSDAANSEVGQERQDKAPSEASEDSEESDVLLMPQQDTERDLQDFVDPQLQRAIETINQLLNERSSAQAA